MRCHKCNRIIDSITFVNGKEHCHECSREIFNDEIKRIVEKR